MRRSFDICLIAISYFCVSGNIAKAQVTPDNTVDTTVNRNGNVSEITGVVAYSLQPNMMI